MDTTIALQRDMIARLQYQLAEAQKALGLTPQAISESAHAANSQITGATLPPWSTDPDVMMPLLVAYDSRIQELEISNKGLVDSVMAARNAIQELASENENLRAENATRAYGAKMTGAFAKSIITSGPDMQRQSELEEIAELSSQEAKALREEVTLLLKEIEELRSGVRDRDAALEQAAKQQKSLMSSLQQAQNVLKTLDTERRVAEQEILRLSSRLAEVQREADTLRTNEANLQKSLEQRLDQLKDYKNAIEELTAQANKEAEHWMQRNRSGAARTLELKAQLDEAYMANQQLKEQVRAMDLELTTTKADAEGMLKVITRLEQQVADFTQSEARVRSSEELAAASVQAMAVERDQAVAKEAQARRELARLLEKRRLEIAEAQAHEVEAVSQTRTRLLAQISARDEEVSRLRESLVAATSTQEKIAREGRVAQQEFQRLESSLREEISKARRDQDALLEKLRIAQDAKDAANRQAREAVAVAAAHVEEAKHDRQQLLERALTAENALHKLTLTVSELESKVRSLQLLYDETQHQLKSARDEQAALKRRHEGELQRMTRRHDMHRLEDAMHMEHDALLETQRRTQRPEPSPAATAANPDTHASAMHLQMVEHDLVVLQTVRDELEQELTMVRSELANAEQANEELQAHIRRLQTLDDNRVRELTETRTQLEALRLTLQRAQAREETYRARVEELEAMQPKQSFAPQARDGVVSKVSLPVSMPPAVSATQLRGIPSPFSPTGSHATAPSMNSDMVNVDAPLLMSSFASVVTPPALSNAVLSALTPSPGESVTKQPTQAPESFSQLHVQQPQRATQLESMLKSAQEKFAEVAAKATQGFHMGTPAPAVKVEPAQPAVDTSTAQIIAEIRTTTSIGEQAASPQNAQTPASNTSSSKKSSRSETFTPPGDDLQHPASNAAEQHMPLQYSMPDSRISSLSTGVEELLSDAVHRARSATPIEEDQYEQDFEIEESVETPASPNVTKESLGLVYAAPEPTSNTHTQYAQRFGDPISALSLPDNDDDFSASAFSDSAGRSQSEHDYF